MRLTVQYTVWCETWIDTPDEDEPKCREWAYVEGENVREAKREAKRLGWTERDGKTLCPACAESDPRLTVDQTTTGP